MSEDRARHILREVVGLIAPEVEFDTLDPAGSLREQADLDSMDFLELLSLLSDATKEEIPEADVPRLDTVDSAVAYLVSKLG